MHQKIDRTPGRLHRGKCRIDRGRLGDVAMADDDTADFFGEWLDAPFKRVPLIGERELGAVHAASLGDAPSERALIGDPYDQAALAAHEARDFRHSLPPLDVFGAEPPMA